MSNLNLRVFRRSSEDIVIVWSTKYLYEDQLKNVRITIGGKPIKFKSALANADDQNRIAKGSVVAVIPYEENGLSADIEYFINVALGKIKIVSEEIQVFPDGVLPSKTKDDSKKISQMYGFVENDKKWRKVQLIEKDGVFCIPVIVMNDIKEKKK